MDFQRWRAIRSAFFHAGESKSDVPYRIEIESASRHCWFLGQFRWF